MKKAFIPKAVISLLAEGNREINGNHYCCNYPCIYPYFNALINQMEGIQGLSSKNYFNIGARKHHHLRINTGAYSMNWAGGINTNSGKRNIFLGLIAENKHTKPYSNKTELPMM